MPVTLPTAADVRKVREQAAKNAAERAEAARTPLLAVLGAGDAAVTVVTKAIVDAQTRRRAQADKVQAYVTALPQKAHIREISRRARQEFVRSRTQQGNLRATVALEPEGGGTSGSMHPAMRFRFNDPDAKAAGDLRAEARTGNAAADNQDVEIAHRDRRLRFGKPCRLGLTP